MLIYAIAFLLGIGLIFKLTVISNSFVAGILLLVCFIALVKVKQLKLVKAVYWGLWVIIGYCWGIIFLNHLLAWQLPESRKFIITGVISSIPEQKNNHLKFLLAVKRLCIAEYCINKPALIQLSWYGQYPKLGVGEIWQLAVRLKRPHGPANPGGFDKESYFLQQRVRAVGTVIDQTTDNRILANKTYYAPVARLRQLLLRKVERVLADNPYLGFIEALTLGVKQHISSQQWQLLQATGTSHLMAISGLHIGLVAGVVYRLAKLAWRRLAKYRQLALLVPAQQVAAICSLLAGLSYSLLAGFSIPTQRSLIMLTVLLVLLIIKRSTFVWQGLALALFAVLIRDPLAVLSISFWLSFGAVASIIYGTAGRYRKQNLWWRYGRVQWVVTLGLLPLSLFFFQQLSLSAFLINLFTIPWVSFITIPLALLGTLLVGILPYLASGLLKLSALSLQLIFNLLTWFAELKFLLWQQVINNFFVLAAVIIAILLLLTPRGFPARWLGIVWLLPLFFTKNPAPKLGELWFSVVDVGQGLSVVMRTQNHILLYDTGPKYGRDYNAGDFILIPYLRFNNIKKIDVLIISHGDSDHSGGAKALLQHLDISQVITSVSERYSQFAAKPCQVGMSWQWDKVQFEFIAPPIVSKFKNNNRSCVLRINIGKYHILLPGDIEKAGEAYLVKQQTNKLPANILVAPHHGSTTSSTPEFIQLVKPDYVIFATGYLNRFGFPKTAVVERYKALGAKNYNTADCGMISFKISSTGIAADKACYRQTLPQY